MNFFDYDIELDVLVEAFKWARQLKDHEPLKSIIVKEVNPGNDKMITDKEIRGGSYFFDINRSFKQKACRSFQENDVHIFPCVSHWMLTSLSY